MQQDIIAPKITATSGIPHVNTPVAVASQGGNDPALQPLKNQNPPSLKKNLADVQPIKANQDTPAKSVANNDKQKAQSSTQQLNKKQSKPVGAIVIALGIGSLLIGLAVYAQILQSST